MNIESAVQGSLFVHDFLTESVSQLSDWQTVDDAALDELERALHLFHLPHRRTPGNGDLWPLTLA